MKKLLLLSAFCILGTLLFAKAPNGFLPEALEKDSHIQTLWDTIFANKPISVNLVLPPEQEYKRSGYENLIKRSFTAWFTDTAKKIRESGRAQEMADILPVLDKGIKVTFDGTGFKIKLYVYDSIKVLRNECQSDMAIGCANGEEIRVTTPEVLKQMRPDNPPDLQVTLSHEFGHLLGFSDQYIEGILNDIDYVPQQYGSSLVYATETVMSGSDTKGKIGCDDTDGMIKMIDVKRGGQRGARKGKAWKSFCPESKDYFLNGKRTRKELYHIRKNYPMQGIWTIDLGKGEEELSIDLKAPLSPAKIANLKITKVLSKDPYNRTNKATGSNGETIYYENIQGVTRKAAFIKDKLAWVEITYQDRLSKEYFHQVYFGGAGKLSLIEWRKPSRFYYEEGFYPYDINKHYGIEISCNANDCKFTKDNFTEYDPFSKGHSSPFLGKMNFEASPDEIKISANLIRQKVKSWFKALPDK